MARPRKINEEVVGKLEYAFMKGFNVTEACDYAEISRDTYYDNLKKNKLNLAEAIESGDLDESKYYLERKCKDEFSPKQEIQHSGTMEINNPMANLTTDELRKLIGDG